MNKKPLVSCLMITRLLPERRVFIRASLQCYAWQTHKNRELVVVFDRVPVKDERWFRKLCREFGVTPRLVRVARKRKLGELRNLSLENARGAIGIQWDDDDFSHPKRIAIQLKSLQKEKVDAVILSQICHFFVEEKAITIEDWRPGRVKALPSTMMQRLPQPLRYPSIDRHEDTIFLERLDVIGRVVRLAAPPETYIYIVHAANVSPAAHHAHLRYAYARAAKKYPKSVRSVRSMLRRLEFPGAAEVRFTQLKSDAVFQK